MYLLCGFVLMYPSGSAFGLEFFDGYLPAIGSSVTLSTGLPNEEIGMPYGMDYSQQADFFFKLFLLLPQCQLCQVRLLDE